MFRGWSVHLPASLWWTKAVTSLPTAPFSLAWWTIKARFRLSDLTLPRRRLPFAITASVAPFSEREPICTFRTSATPTWTRIPICRTRTMVTMPRPTRSWVTTIFPSSNTKSTLLSNDFVFQVQFFTHWLLFIPLTVHTIRPPSFFNQHLFLKRD